jgi:integrase
VLPRIGGLKAKEVTRRQIGELLDVVVERGARRIANKLLEGLRQMFRWAMSRDIVSVDPTLGLTKRLVGGEEKPRERALSFEEVSDLLAKLPAAGLAPEIRAGVLLLLATGARIGELLKAKWSDIDEAAGAWRIPAENSKNGEAHLIHLSAFAAAQLAVMRDKRSGDYLLNGRKENAPYDDKALSKMLRDRVRAKPLKNRTAKHAGTLLLSGGEWSPHDLRRTAASRMGDLGILPHVIERCLGHKPPSKIVQTYQRQEYLPERAEAFRLWGERLELLSHPAQNVVLLSARA